MVGTKQWLEIGAVVSVVRKTTFFFFFYLNLYWGMTTLESPQQAGISHQIKHPNCSLLQNNFFLL